VKYEPALRSMECPAQRAPDDIYPSQFGMTLFKFFFITT